MSYITMVVYGMKWGKHIFGKERFSSFFNKRKSRQNKKSKHRLKVEQQYRKLGYSKEESEKKSK